jgi:hypothetical protein
MRYSSTTYEFGKALAPRSFSSEPGPPLPCGRPHLTNWTASSALTGGLCGRRLNGCSSCLLDRAMILDEATAPNFGQAKRFEQLCPGESIQHQTPTEGL